MNKLVLITGAGSGIGEATSILFSARGWQVALLGRNVENLKRTQSQCANPTHLIPCDLSKSSEIDKAANLVSQIPKVPLYGLINNAGIFETQKQMGGDLDSWRRQFEINLFGAVQLTQTLLPALTQIKGASIVNVSSTLGLKTASGLAAYSASKAAMISWTQTLALELGCHEVRANCVCPGLVDTPIHSFHGLADSEKTAAIKKLGPLQPLGRIGTPDDIAKAIYFLASEDSSWTTGAVLSVDGGINLT